MYPVLLKYWCLIALVKIFTPIWYLIPFGFVFLPLFLISLNREAYMTLKRHELQKVDMATKSVTSAILSQFGWDTFWRTTSNINSDEYIFGDLVFKIATFLESLSLFPDVMNPIFDGINSIAAGWKMKHFRPVGSVYSSKKTDEQSDAAFYAGFDMIEDILSDLSPSSEI